MFKHRPIEIEPIKQLNLPEGRRYAVPGDFKYPSITNVLGKTKDNSALIAWRKRVGEEQANKISMQATTRGTAMHNLCENYLLNEELDDLGSSAGELLFRGMKPKLDRMNNIRCLETGLYSHRLRIAGSVDCIAELDGILSVIDFKTSSKPKKTEYIEDYFLQGAFYFNAYYEITKELPKQIAILISVMDGSTQEFVLKGKDIIKYSKKLEDRISAYYYNQEKYDI